MGVNLTVRNVPEDVVQRLRERARRRHRSLQGELLTLLEAAAQQEAMAVSDEAYMEWRERVDKLAREAGALWPPGVSAIEAVREGRRS